MQYTVLGVLPTLNDHDKANRVNRFAGAKLKKEATELVYYQLLNKPKVSKPCFITFHWYISSRADPDNIRIGAKYLLDGMVKAGILQDDNQKHILGFKGDYFYKVAKGDEKVVVGVEYWIA